MEEIKHRCVIWKPIYIPILRTQRQVVQISLQHIHADLPLPRFRQGGQLFCSCFLCIVHLLHTIACFDDPAIVTVLSLKIHFTTIITVDTSPRSVAIVEGEWRVDTVTGHTLYRTARVSNANIMRGTQGGQTVKGDIEITEQLIGKPDIPAAAPEKK